MLGDARRLQGSGGCWGRLDVGQLSCVEVVDGVVRVKLCQQRPQTTATAFHPLCLLPWSFTGREGWTRMGPGGCGGVRSPPVGAHPHPHTLLLAEWLGGTGW